MKCEVRVRSLIQATRAGWLASFIAIATASSDVRAQDIGFEGPQFTGAGATPTESKPESKLWFNDGVWWGSLWSSTARAFVIHRLDFATHTWSSTGVVLDSRPNSHGDALWDGTSLYFLTHAFSATGGSSGNPIRVLRYTFDSGSHTYIPDEGFPVTVGDFSTEAAGIEKDSTGTLWVAWTQGQRVRICHTLADETHWSSPVVHPRNTTNLTTDDLCGIVHFGGNKIGVLWSDQSANAYRFSVHADGAADTVWAAAENATTGESDDHLNLAVHSDGRVFVVCKNLANNLLLLVRSTSGTWSRYVVTQPTPILTRPVVLLNEETGRVHVFATGQDTGEVFEKASPLSPISFPSGTGTIRMRDSSEVFRISDPTSTKQNVDGTTGMVVLAHHDSTGFYWHHDVLPAPPVADFGASPTQGTIPLAVGFTDASTGNITTRSWSFGDGTSSSSTSPSHTYVTAGTYTVGLTATGPGGADSEIKTGLIVALPPPPVAGFGASPTSGVVPLQVAFTDASTGSISSRSWSFGDGTTSTATNPSHVYSTAGTFTVSLTATGPGGADTETKTDFIVVLPPPPVAAFGALPTSGAAPLDVAFTDASTGSITSRSWSFGDGTTSTATSPGHVYPAAGTYTVSLTVTGPGGSDSEIKQNFVTVSPPQPPVAAFTASPTSGIAPLAVTFTDTSTGSMASWLWDFGDGTTSSVRNPVHNFAVGTFTVSLTVAGPAGSDAETKPDWIQVSGAPAVRTFLSVADAPVNESSPSSNSGTAVELRVRSGAGNQYHSYVRFDLSSLSGSVRSAKLRLYCTDENDLGGLVFPTSSSWTETGITWANRPPATGGQIASLGAVAVDTWYELDVTAGVAAGGPVSLLLTGASTSSARYSSREGANPPQLVVETSPPVRPVAEFSAGPRAGSAPLAVTFADQSTGSPSSWSWSFGDGATSTERAPTHMYTEPGCFTVTLLAGNAAGSSEMTKARFVVVRWPSTAETLLPVADARVYESSPTTNAGTATELRVREEDGASYHSYLRFDLTGVTGTVRSARLRLYCTDENDLGGLVFPTSSAWTETGITWANKPPASGGQIASLGVVEVDTWYELDVTAAVTTGGPVSFILTGASSSSARYSSREGANSPELVVETERPVPYGVDTRGQGPSAE